MTYINTNKIDNNRSGLFELLDNYKDSVNKTMLSAIRPQVYTPYYPELPQSKPSEYELLKLKNGIKAIGYGAGLVTDYFSNYLSKKLFDDSELGRGMGILFSSGLGSAGSTITNNLVKGTTLMQGLNKNVGESLAGAGVGLASNYIGRGISALGGDSMLSRGIGQGVVTGLGTVGGQAVSNLFKYGSLVNKAKDATEATSLIGKGAGAINPYALGMSVVGAGLGAAFGPSKEYDGRYGNITKTMDTTYDIVLTGVNFVPGAGLVISGAMALNKGLSNIFGSTDGMTKTDAILGSAFMPAPVKWLNMAGANTTDTFGKLSWQNSLKASTFMGNAFGNLQDKFDLAREESSKTYGTFSQRAYRDAESNINFSKGVWDRILAMADLNELLNIRSLYMSSINNLRYALLIRGAWLPTARGKEGMKIFNNATNHNIGMRLLSGAALIDNKQMILCNVPD